MDADQRERDATRCGECSGVLEDSACVDCGTKHGPAPITLAHLRELPDGTLTKAEVILLVDYIERLERLIARRNTSIDLARSAVIELTENYNRLCAAVATRLEGIEPGRYIVLADDLSLLVVEDGLLEQDDLVIYDRARPL